MNLNSFSNQKNRLSAVFLVCALCLKMREPSLSDNLRPDGRRTRPAFPSASASFRRAKQKNFLYIFLIACPPKFFSIKETKNFLFCLPLARGIAETPPPHSPPLAGRQAGKNSFSPHPFFFLPACFRASPDFFADGL